jgi:HTH-type transcriptional regulator/antitoxin HigA
MMENQGLIYKVIKTKEQYYNYCALLEEFILSGDHSRQDEIDLLEVLIDAWDNDNDIFDEYDPVQLIQALMAENNMKQIDLAEKIGIGESYLSEILSYKKGLSKKNVQKLADLFSIRPEILTRAYPLKRASGMERLAAGVNYLIGNETSEGAFVFGEPAADYKKPNPSPAKPIAVKKNKNQ